MLVSFATDELWDIDSRRALTDRLAAVDRGQGALYALSLTLLAAAQTEISAGRFAEADACYAQADDFFAATGFPADGAVNRDSVELLSQVPVALDLAHTRLMFGEWLRRRKRRGEAREQLRAAHQLFDSCGAVPFAERARAELLATGEQLSKRTTPARNDLTPQERHVAALAAGGSTNAEIASRLFITVSAVEFHLNKVFRKLGISSRRQIASRIGTERAEEPGDDLAATPSASRRDPR